MFMVCHVGQQQQQQRRGVGEEKNNISFNIDVKKLKQGESAGGP